LKKSKSINHKGHKGIHKGHKGLYYSVLALCPLCLLCVLCGKKNSTSPNSVSLMIIMENQEFYPP
jgi:hypothetical protein